MSRYRPRHSSRFRELERSAPVRRSARIWAAAVGTAFVVLVTAVVLTTGGWERAVYTISGDELKEEEAQLRSETATASPEATGSIEATGGEF